MGYIILLILGGAAVVLLLMAVMSGRRRPAGRTMHGQDVTVKTPAAESPTPSASSTATSQEAGNAQRHTPPG